MTISIIFSIIIFQLNFHEVGIRLENLQQGLLNTPTIDLNPSIISTLDSSKLLQAQSEQAAIQMLLSLVYINVVILVAGGVGGYFLARRTLKPLEQAHEAQSRFTSDASHELRTPLSAMKTELEVTLRDQKLDPIEAREQLESNLEEVNKLIQLSEMLLKMARLDYDQMDRTQVDLVELLHAQLKLFPKSVKRFDITTRKAAIAVANLPAVTELINILVDNAIKYSPPKSKISVRIFERRLMAGFEITNSGPVIPADKLPRLFDRFYRGDTSRTAGDKNGYGLGLAIAKKIIDIHHGYLYVTSTEKGTTFTFYLPTVKFFSANIKDSL